MPRFPEGGKPYWFEHWPEYAIEAALLGIFMLSACLFATLLFYPDSPLLQLIPDRFARRVIMGIAMGATAVALNYSAWGKQSGAHYNPAVTLTFTRLGKIAPRDAVGYVTAQFIGAAAGVFAATLIVGSMLAHSEVHYVVTRPGAAGVAIAFVAEAAISFLLMIVVLAALNRASLARFTGLFAGLLVAAFITVEAPLSGMSMNPARTVGSALWAQDWTALWLYFTAPPLGMLAAAEVHLRLHRKPVFCAKLHHQNNKRCIFCEYQGRGLNSVSGARTSVSGERREREAVRAALSGRNLLRELSRLAGEIPRGACPERSRRARNDQALGTPRTHTAYRSRLS
jgi:aquaporin Z